MLKIGKMLVVSALILASTAGSATAGQRTTAKPAHRGSSTVVKQHDSHFASFIASLGTGAPQRASMPTGTSDSVCVGAIDPGGIFCAIACPCTCNFGYLASQCCCDAL